MNAWNDRHLRLWPAIVIAGGMWLAMYIPPLLYPGTTAEFMPKMFAPMFCVPILALWWLLASRAPWTERFIALAALGVIAGGSLYLSDANARFLGPIVYIYPLLVTAWAGWCLIASAQKSQIRLPGLVLIFLLAWGWLPAVRIEGTTGTFALNVAPRWSKTAEQRLKEANVAKVSLPTTETLKLEPGDWPEFRGPARDSKLAGVTIPENWVKQPQHPLWRHPVGPGWSSFAVVGDRLFTQEQRDSDECVVCYKASTGEQVWVTTDSARFEEAIAGPGPRATPTFADGKLYAQGAAGQLQCLDPTTGQTLWKRDVKADTGAKTPMWGFSSSPLVTHGLAIVYTGAPEGRAVAAYKIADGTPAWYAGDEGHGYCSPQLATLGGVEQMLIVGEKGAASFEVETGKQLWVHDWPMDKDMARCTQPAVVDGSDVLIGSFFGVGTRRLHIEHAGETWTVTPNWTTKAIKPYYNDLVVHKGYLYGFDANFLVCVDLANGKLKWKVRGYDNGQVLLLPDRDQLLVLSEKGEIALVDAKPEKHVEHGKFPAINGKTWNHPVIANGKLFVRNGEEAACFALPTP